MTTSFPYTYAWKNNEVRARLYGRRCKVLARGKLRRTGCHQPERHSQSERNMTYKSDYRVNQTKFYQCHRKVLFLDEQAAKNRAEQINQQEGYRKMEAYQCNCDGCHGWHLRRVKKNIKKAA